jgi:hypothetical protein
MSTNSHIESLWQPGMTWKNNTINGWHIDHIIPCEAFNLFDIEEQKKCFHYTNLQPLWSNINIAKSDILPDGARARFIEPLPTEHSVPYPLYE